VKAYIPAPQSREVILAVVAAAGPEGATTGRIHDALGQAWVTNWPDVTEGMIRYLAREGQLREQHELSEGEPRWVLST